MLVWRERRGRRKIIASGPTLAIEAESTRLAFVGADADLSATGEAPFSSFDIRVSRSMLLRRGDILRVGPLRGSATLYMAVEGGFDIAPVMGSVSTYLRGGLGGFQGRSLAAGDVLPLKRNWASERPEQALHTGDFAPRSRLRVLEGPQSDHFGEKERAAFFRREYVVGPGWNRMGMRLIGEPVTHSRGYNVTSDGIVRGSIQVPATDCRSFSSPSTRRPAAIRKSARSFRPICRRSDGSAWDRGSPSNGSRWKRRRPLAARTSPSSNACRRAFPR